MAELPPEEYVRAEVEAENLRYEESLLNEALSNFPLILTPYEDVDYIDEVERFLKNDKEDFKRILHSHLLSNGSNGGWLHEILKSAMKETMGFKDNSEVDAFVKEHFQYYTFKDFINNAYDVVRVEEDRYFPVLSDPINRELYEDVVASVKNKDDKERKKDEQIKRNLDNPDSVRGHYEGVNQLRQAIQQAVEVHGQKEYALRYIPAMDGTDKTVPGINYNYVQTEYKNIFNVPLNTEACKRICGRSTLMRGMNQGKPKCLVETIAMHEHKTAGVGEHPGMYIALKGDSVEYGQAQIEAAVEECRSRQSEVENRQTNRYNRDQMNYVRRQQQQERSSGESQIQRDARERREAAAKRDAEAAAAAALTVPTRSDPPPSATASIPPSTNQRPRNPNETDSSDRMDALARGGAAPSSSAPANAMGAQSDDGNEYGDAEDEDNLGYSDEDEDDDDVERKKEGARKKAERERRQREQRHQESNPPEPAPSPVQQHPSSVSRSATPAHPEAAEAAMHGRPSTPAAPRSHSQFTNKKNVWEDNDDEDTPTVVERTSPVQQLQQQQQQPLAADPPQQHTSVFAPRPITSDDYQQQPQQPQLQQVQPVQQQQQLQPGQQPNSVVPPTQQPQQPQQPQYPPSSFPPATPTPSSVYGDGMQQVPPQPQQQQPYVFPPQQQMQPPFPPQGPYMGQPIPPSPAPSQSNIVPGQPQIYHPIPHYAGYPPGSIPPTPPMQPMQQPGAPYGGVPPPYQHPSPYPHPQQYAPPPQGAPYGYYQPPVPQQPYYQGAPNQQPMQQPQYPQGSPGYPPTPVNGNNNAAPVVNVHVSASPSPSPPAGADHHNYNPNHPPAPAHNYPPDQRWSAPPGSHPPQGYDQRAPHPPPNRRQSPPRREQPPPPFRQYYPRGDSPPPRDNSHYQPSSTRDDRQSSHREFGSFNEGRRQPEELVMYDEDRAARQGSRSRGSPMEYGGNRSMEGQRQGYESGFGRGTGFGRPRGTGFGEVARVERRFDEAPPPPPRGFAQTQSQNVHHQYDRPPRAVDGEGFVPRGTSTPLHRSPERARLWNRMEPINDPRKNIRWQIICILKNNRDRNIIRMKHGDYGHFDSIGMDELFELVQLCCGNEMELFQAIANYPGNQFLEFLKEMDRDRLICLYHERRRRNDNNQKIDDIYYVLDPHLKPPPTFGVPRWLGN